MATFINYRRDDDPGFAAALYEKLENEFGAKQLFMDVEGHIRPGDDFVEVIRTQVAQCRVMLTIIGPRWTGLMAVRANDPQDFVVMEIEAALMQGKLAIRADAGGASMPAGSAPPKNCSACSAPSRGASPWPALQCRLPGTDRQFEKISWNLSER